MVERTFSISIKAPAASVVQLYSDAGRLREWQPLVKRVDGSLERVGDHCLVSWGGIMKRRAVVEAVEASHLHIVTFAFPFGRGREEARFSESNGSTELVLLLRLQASPLFRWLEGGPLIRDAIKAHQRDLEALRGVAEHSR